MADLVEIKFQENVKRVDGGQEVLQKLRNNKNPYDIAGLKTYAAVEGRVQGPIAGVRDHGFLHVKPIEKVGHTLDFNPRVHNNGVLDYVYDNNFGRNEILAIGSQFDLDDISIRSGSGPRNGSLVYYRDDLVAVLAHEQGQLGVTTMNGQDVLAMRPNSF